MTLRSPTISAESATATSPHQLGLFTDRDWWAATEKWVRENEAAYALFVQFALDLGRKRGKFGFKAIAERVRWEMAFERNDDEFRVNNNMVSYIARRIVREHPELEGKVEFRRVAFGPSRGRG